MSDFAKAKLMRSAGQAYRRVRAEAGAFPYLVAAACVMAGLITRLALEPIVPGLVPFATFFPSVAAAGLLTGYRPAAFAFCLTLAAAWLLTNWMTPAAAGVRNMIFFALTSALTTFVCASFHDLLGRYESAKEEAEADRRQLRFALDAGRLGTAWFDFTADRGGWSSATATMFGLPPDCTELSRSEWIELVHPEDRSLAEAALVKAAAREDGFYFAEYRIVRPCGEIRSLEFRGTVSRTPEGAPSRIEGLVSDATDRRRLEDQRTMLVSEMRHRVKNIITTISALARHSARNAIDTAQYTSDLMGRLNALAASHDLLFKAGDGLMLDELVHAEAAAYGKDRVFYHGHPFRLPGPSVMGLGLVVHELVTNSAKYGALSAAHGRVDVIVKVDGVGSRRSLCMTWIEVGGPPVMLPIAKGFGTTLIERTIEFDLQGTVDRDFSSVGLRIEIHLPISSLEVVSDLDNEHEKGVRENRG